MQTGGDGGRQQLCLRLAGSFVVHGTGRGRERNINLLIGHLSLGIGKEFYTVDHDCTEVFTITALALMERLCCIDNTIDWEIFRLKVFRLLNFRCA